MTPVERAAKAVEDHCWQHEAHQPLDPHGIARTALATTHEPTPEMIKAGAQLLDACFAEEDVKMIWEAMHDAMMAEKETK